MRKCAVSRAAEAVEHGFLAGRCYLVDLSGALASFIGRAVERAVDVEEACSWVIAPGAVVEVAPYGFPAGLRETENRAATLRFGTPVATDKRRAVERVVDVDEARTRVLAVLRPTFETVEQAVRKTRVRSLRARWR